MQRYGSKINQMEQQGLVPFVVVNVPVDVEMRAGMVVV